MQFRIIRTVVWNMRVVGQVFNLSKKTRNEKREMKNKSNVSKDKKTG